MPVLRMFAVAALVVLASCSSSTGYVAPPPPPPPPPGPPPPPPPPPPATATVQVQDNAFNPAVDTVASAGTVTWNWSGAAVHNVTFEDGNGNSADLSTGTHGRTFGTVAVSTAYRYRCTLHSTSFTSGMTGRIVVRP